MPLHHYRPTNEVDLLLRHVLKIPRKRFNRCSLYCASLSFCFYLVSFAYSFSRIVQYAPSRSKQNLLC